MDHASQLRRVGYIPSGASGDIPAAMGGGIAANVSVSATGNSGRPGLLVLFGVVVGLGAFYVWTRSIQGGG